MLLWNPVYFIFAMPAFLLALYAQWKVNASYQRYLRVPNAAGMTGVDAARRMLQTAGIQVKLEGIPGNLTDHYDPRRKVLRLSSGVAERASVASVAIVAHEIGHALQDAQAYALLRLRSGLVPVVNFTSWLGPILFLAGMFLQVSELLTLGVWMFLGAVIFSLVTLPVEIDASRRALQLLQQSHVLVDSRELKGAKTVLNAAALTYVAALAQSLSTLFYYLFILNGSRGRRRS